MRAEEMKDINAILEDYERRKRGLSDDVGRDMRKKLARATTDEERERVLMEYAANLQKYTDALEKQKQSQLEDLRARLLEKRRKHKKDLHKVSGYCKSMVSGITVVLICHHQPITI